MMSKISLCWFNTLCHITRAFFSQQYYYSVILQLTSRNWLNVQWRNLCVDATRKTPCHLTSISRAYVCARRFTSILRWTLADCTSSDSLFSLSTWSLQQPAADTSTLWLGLISNSAVHFFCSSSSMLEDEGPKLQYETGECCLITQ